MAENQKGTFIVKINHTDNASWQGQVTWADKNITKNFRSTLELIKLMDGAITSEETKTVENMAGMCYTALSCEFIIVGGR